MPPPTRTGSWSRGARSPGGRRRGVAVARRGVWGPVGVRPQEQRMDGQEQPRELPRDVKESVMQTKLSTEVRQSLSLLAMTALTLLASIGLGILAGQLG